MSDPHTAAERAAEFLEEQAGANVIEFFPDGFRFVVEQR